MAPENIPSAAPAPAARSTQAANGNNGGATSGIAGALGTQGTPASTAAAPGTAAQGSSSSGASSTTPAQGFQSVMAGVSQQSTPDTSSSYPAAPIPVVVAPVIPLIPVTPVVAGATGKATSTAPAPVIAPKPVPVVTTDVTPTVTVDPLIAGTRTTAPATTASPSGSAKPTNTKTPATSTDEDTAEAAAACDAAAAALAGALALPGMCPQTAQVPAAPPATATPAAPTSAVTGNGAQSEAAAEQVDLNAALALPNGSGAKSLALPAAKPVSRDADTVAALADVRTLSASDHSSASASGAQMAPLHAAFMHSQSAADFDPSPTLRAPVGSNAWTDELGAHLTWMSRNGQESGSLHVSPEHLGPVEVRIEVRDGAASVWFGAAHPATRAALEHALPRLHDMFAASGLQLTDSGVARDAPRQNAKPVTPMIAPIGHGNVSPSISNTTVTRSRSGILDTYV